MYDIQKILDNQTQCLVTQPLGTSEGLVDQFKSSDIPLNLCIKKESHKMFLRIISPYKQNLKISQRRQIGKTYFSIDKTLFW